MKSNVIIVDYGIGNVSSVLRAIKKFAANVELTDNVSKIINADRLIVPGDGAFGDSMQNLKKRKLIEPILQFIARGKPFLGICVGMQILLSESEEFGKHVGLNLLPGKVKRFNFAKNLLYKIPQIGWNRLIKPKNVSWNSTILEGLKEGDWVYFIHSYIVIPDNTRYNLALTKYGNTTYTSVVMKNNVSACQFHPEKSGEVGLTILKNFINGYKKNI